MSGLVANDPVKTPVLSFSSICRSTSLLRDAARRYAVTAASGVPLAAASVPFHASGVPSGQPPAGTSSATKGCSGATTMKVAPNSVSGRVVKTSMTSSAPARDPAARVTGKRTDAPVERPIQLRCMILTFSGHSTRSRSSASRSAYAVIRIIHWRRLRRNTGKLPRSERPSLVTSSFDSTVPKPGHQLTGASDV